MNRCSGGLRSATFAGQLWDIRRNRGIVLRAKRLAKRHGVGKLVLPPPKPAAVDFAKILKNSQEETS
jgi:hypothetical protein